MKIDKKKLTDLLVEKTGMEMKAVEEQLDQLIERIQDAAGKGKALEIKGFGMFYFSKTGDLKFDPSEELQTEANYKYTGMEPVEIKKPRESPESSVQEEPEAEKEEPEEDKVKEDIWGFDDGSDSESELDKEASETGSVQAEKNRTASTEDVKPELLTGKEEESEEAYDPFAEFDHGFIKSGDEGETDKSAADEKKPLDPATDELFPDLTDEPFEFDTERSKTDSGKPERKKEPVGKTKKPVKKTGKKEKNPVSTLVVALVTVLVIVIGAVIAYDLGVMDGIFGDADSPQEFTQAEPQPQAPPVDAELNATEEPEQQQQHEDEAEPADQEQPGLTAIEEVEVPDTPIFGLEGPAQSIDGRYYSIILHSVRSENRAEEMREELQNQGYRAVIASVNHEEFGTMWRVGIGQFESIPSAQDAASELPPNYRDNHFIGLIQ